MLVDGKFEPYSSDENKYAWREIYSIEHQETYYYNSISRESTWEKPQDLGWKLIRYEPEL